MDIVVDERGRAAESFITIVGQLRQKEERRNKTVRYRGRP